MVKPPTTMQPESVDLTKAGRAAGKSFQDDSFRNYMARKIDLQRKQFGLVLAPAPEPSFEQQQQQHQQHQVVVVSSPSKVKNHRVSFSLDNVKEGGHRCIENSVSTTKEDRKKKKKKRSGTTAGISAVLERLKRRHGESAGDARMQCDIDENVTESAASREENVREHDQPLDDAKQQLTDSSVFCIAAQGSSEKCSSPSSGVVAPPDPSQVVEISRLKEPFSQSLELPTVPSSKHNTDKKPQSNHCMSSPASTSTAITRNSIIQQRPDLFFYGVVVIVNGYTDPDTETLQRLLHRHGGDLERYETSRVTHVIATALSFAKANVYRKQRRKPIPVCRPAWIVDSVAARKLLPYQDYILAQLRDKDGARVQSMASFLKPTPNSSGISIVKSTSKNNTREAEVGIAMASEESNCAVNTEKSAPTENLVDLSHEGGGGLKATDLTEEKGNSASTNKLGLFLQEGGGGLHATDVTKEKGNSAPTENLVDFSQKVGGDLKVIDLTKEKENGASINQLAVFSQESGGGLHATDLAEKYGNRAPIDNLGVFSQEAPIDATDLVVDKGVSAPTDNLVVFSQEAGGGLNVNDLADEKGFFNGKQQLHAPLNQLPGTEGWNSIVELDQELSFCSPRRGLYPAEVAEPSLDEDQRFQMDQEPNCSTAENVHDTSDMVEPSLAQDQSRRTDAKYFNGRVRTVGTDPNFLESFFHSSRLSFIGSFKQRARQSPKKLKQDTSDTTRLIFHVDMDSFFASVVLRNFPQYRHLPVVISHLGKRFPPDRASHADDKTTAVDSTSECATCNYEARKFGIEKGMYLGRAKQLCPQLIVLHYDFEGYEEVSEQVSEILFRYAADYSGCVEQVSCDESYMELHLPAEKNCESPDNFAERLASSIRREIFEATRCTASIGVAKNKLLAKLGTDSVKPDGCTVVRDYRHLLAPLQLRQLHGVGYHLDKKLAEEGLTAVQDVWDLGDSAQSVLERILGSATGKKIHSYCNGLDDRPVAPVERKTIGAECNYGVRFNGPYGVDYMIDGLAREVVKRMTLIGLKGASKITYKLKQRKENAPPPPKFLGHGSCNNLSKSCDVPGGGITKDWRVISKLCLGMFNELGVPKEDVRGMGIVISKLVHDKGMGLADQGDKQTLRNWLNSGTESKTLLDPVTACRDDGTSIAPNSVNEVSEFTAFAAPQRTDAARNEGTNAVGVVDLTSNFLDFDIELPSLSQIHMSQVECLPSPLRKCALKKIEALRGGGDTFNVDSRPMHDTLYRQTDVKRMLRLAAVKTGSESLDESGGEKVSLTQLESLPLEMQLQLANGDRGTLGQLSTKSHRGALGKLSTKSSHQVSKRLQRHEKLATRRKGTGDPTMAARRREVARCVGNVDQLNADTSQLSISLAPCDPLAFFEDDIYPLTVFMDENPEAESDSMDKVATFLVLCVEENRLNDVVVLLRSIKNRNDRWSEAAYKLLLNRVNAAVEDREGAMLDNDWI